MPVPPVIVVQGCKQNASMSCLEVFGCGKRGAAAPHDC
jgi:hypothetical protein